MIKLQRRLQTALNFALPALWGTLACVHPSAAASVALGVLAVLKLAHAVVTHLLGRTSAAPDELPHVGGGLTSTAATINH